MVLKTWAPISDLEREMRSFFDRYWPERPSAQLPVRVPVDITREDDHIVITADLPGVDPLVDVDVSVEGNTLTISGERSHEEEVKEDSRVLWERSYGRFERRIGLPDGVDPDTITATYDKGVLVVKVPAPTAETPERRQIPIKAPDA